MGQYYVIVNLTKKQYLRPHAFGCGAKLMEFSNSQFGPQQALVVLTSDGNGGGGGDLATSNLTADEVALIGSWAGDQIVTAGDYGEYWKFFDRAEWDGKTYEEQQPLYKQSNGHVGTMDEVTGSFVICTGKCRTVTRTFGKKLDRATGEVVEKEENLYDLATCFFEDISDRIIAVVAKGEDGYHPWAALDVHKDSRRVVPEWGILPEVEPKKPVGGKVIYAKYKAKAGPEMQVLADELATLVYRNIAAALLKAATKSIKDAAKKMKEEAELKAKRGW